MTTRPPTAPEQNPRTLGLPRKVYSSIAQVKDAKVHWVELDQVVNAVLFLASDAAGAVTGEILPVAGDV